MNTEIPDDATALTTSNALDDCAIQAIEYVAVTVNIKHEYNGDLAIDLVSPSGAMSQLARPRRCETNDRSVDHCGDFLNWQFGSVRHLDEAARGNWQLHVKDAMPGKTGSLRSWSMTIYGR